jgi:hypothetical protein
MNANSIDANHSKITSCYEMNETKQNKNLILINQYILHGCSVFLLAVNPAEKF